MSIDIDWEGLTTGPEGLALAESIKDFIHDKFQQVQLPRFIRSVEVHSFDFGKQCPRVNLKDICDPLPEFYEPGEDGSEDDEEELEESDEHGQSTTDLKTNTQISGNGSKSSALGASTRPSFIDTHFPGYRPDLSRSGTPGIPGGTSNMSYFHLPLSAGISGTQTPLAAVAGGGALPAGWSEAHFVRSHPPFRQHSPVRLQQSQPATTYADPSSRPSTSSSFAQPHEDTGGVDSGGVDNRPQPQPNVCVEPDPSDVQVVMHIAYSGNVRLSITAEILLDYPMPSFVGIPLKLNITGLSFDGVALIAYLRKKAHFCFLGPEDARTLVGSEIGDKVGDHIMKNSDEKKNEGLGGLLREIQVESEIGRQEGGKQVLKNVGKVEKFVLEQVRRIFEEEF
ncbi:MAG: hypothetical protein Q9170_006846, partial [Blastenia crenularia]